MHALFKGEYRRRDKPHYLYIDTKHSKTLRNNNYRYYYIYTSTKPK